MKAEFIADKITIVEPLDLAEAYTVAFRKVLRFNPEKSTIAALMAQSALETGRGKSCHNFNISNIKSGSNYLGFYSAFRCNEVIKGKTKWFSPQGAEEPKGNIIHEYSAPPWHPQTRFRAYKSLADAAKEKLEFLALDSNPNDNKPNRYDAAMRAFIAGDAYKAALELGAAGYYTAPVPPYARSMVSLQKEFLALIHKQTFDTTPTAEQRLCENMALCMRVELPEWLRKRVEIDHALVAIDDDLRDEMKRGRTAELDDLDYT